MFRVSEFAGRNTASGRFVDNIALAYLCRNTTLSNALKHVRRRYFFVKDMAEVGEVVVTWIEGKHNEADALTKALPEPRFRELTALFRGRKPRMLRALMAGLRKLGWVRSEAGSWRKAHGEGPAE